MVCIDKSIHVHHKDFGRRTRNLYKGWASRTKTVCKGFLGPVAQMFCTNVQSVPQSLCTKFESSPRNLCALHQVFLCTKALLTQSCCAHKARSARSLHTDNANGSGIVMLNIIFTVRGMLQTHGHTDRPMDMGHSEGENIQNARTVCNM